MTITTGGVLLNPLGLFYLAALFVGCILAGYWVGRYDERAKRS